MEAEKALNLLAGICSKKEYCSHEVREKLRKWEVTEEASEKIIAFLKRHRFIDDKRYTLAYAEDKLRFNHWGKQKISQQLHQKKIDPELIAEALAQLNPDIYEQNCLELLKQKRSTLHETHPYRLRIKLTRFAAGRGFGLDLISRCLDQIL